MLETTDCPVVFKKRAPKGNVRCKKDFQEEDREEENFKKDTIAELKIEQSFRKRQRGIGIDADGSNKKGTFPISSNQQKNAEIGVMMGNQFAQAKTNISDGPIAHENIMNTFISERLGDLIGTSKTEIETVTITEEDKLYRIPEEIKALEGKSENKADNYGKDEVIGVGSSGLAEVALPIEFKLKNIEETEKAKKRLMEQRYHNKSNRETASTTLALGTASARLYQQNYVNKPRAFPGTGSAEVPKKLPTGVVSVEQEHEIRLPRGMQKSSDDIALDKFKKRERQMRR